MNLRDTFPKNEKDFEWNDQWQTKAVRSHPFATETIKRNDLMINQIKNVQSGNVCFEDAEKHVGHSLAKKYLPEHLINPELKKAL
mgnify:CR=1 FL=1